MLISLPEIIKKYNLNIKGVIQVGAHWAEEHAVYLELGIKKIIYIEPCKDAFDVLRHRFLFPSELNADVNVQLCHGACADYIGKTVMNVSHNNQGQSNSILKPLLHINQHPEVVFNDTEEVNVMPLDDVVLNKEWYNLLVMDCQGAEGLVLKGATETLKHIDCIYTEINTDQTYEGNMLVGEMDEYLSEFIRVETFMPSPNWSWGDACFINKTLLQ